MFENIIKNEVALLKTENEKQLNSLKKGDYNFIKDIMKSMSIFKVNSYDSQVIKRDLIGMAQELDLRNSSLKESIGDNLKDFTNDIINNSNGPDKAEILLSFLCKLSGYFFAWFIGLSFLAYGGLVWEVGPMLFFLFIGLILIGFIVEGIVTPLFSTDKGFRKKLPSIISILLLGLFTMIMYLSNNILYAKTINVSYIIGISAVIYLISKYLYIKNIHELAKNKNNYIEDLI